MTHTPSRFAFVIAATDADGHAHQVRIECREALIGKASDCAVQLSGWRVGRHHARVHQTAQGLVLEDLGHFAGTWVNGSRVVRHGPLTAADLIQIAGHTLRVREEPPSEPAPARPRPDSPARIGLVSAQVAGSAQEATPQPALGPAFQEVASIQARHPWRQRVHGQLLDTIDLRRRDLTRMSDAELRSEVDKLVREIIDGLAELPRHVDRAALTREVLNEAISLGPLEDLLADDAVNEIMVNRFDEIFVERAGRLEWYPLAFSSDRAVMGVIERIVAPLGRRIDESSPLVDARLKDGSRVNAIIPPLALKGPTLTIRRFSRKRLHADDMVAGGSLSRAMVSFLRLCVKYRKNVVVSGGTGSGKTTLLNVLSNFIPDGERIITIEDAAELKLDHTHLVSLESRPPNAEGRGGIAIRDLVRNALRMRPDRIVVGECRGGEALDMLQAMNTGHEGSLTTLHANAPRDALARLETLVLMAGMDLPITAIREQIASAVDIVIQQTRFACGSRKVTAIAEVTGLENGRFQLQELFRFDPRGYGPDGAIAGRFAGCEAIPAFYDELRAQGTVVDLSLFDARSA
ncbi:MAG TPA: ATPase, T2SS/T4P/T4SS family [Albitalea sp.]|uniref:ATPase, T2SS/T4P/T4SS family n=1 Tax=Piscinibacter sp. TaxID=1903157 RepID=UPI002ED4CCFC